MTSIKKKFTKILTIIFAMCMLSCVTIYAVSAQSVAAISSVELVLSENLELKYTVENAPANAKMKFTYKGKSYEEPATEGANTFSFKKVTPQFLGEVVKAELMSEQTVLCEKSISVKDYCYNLLKKTALENGLTEAKNEQMKTLLVDLLYYGSASQKYIAKKDGALTPTSASLVTSALSDEEMSKRSFFTSLSSVASDLNIGASNVVFWYGYGLRFDYNVQMYVEFAVKDSAKVLNVDFNGVETPAVLEKQAHGYDIYKAYFNLKAIDFNTVITAKVKSGAATLGEPLVYSVRSFVKENENNALVGELAKAVYNYGLSAYSYSLAAEHNHSFNGEYGFNGVYGNWTNCASCTQKTWAQLATAVNAEGNIKTEENGPFEYVLKAGGDITNPADYTISTKRVPLSSAAYNTPFEEGSSFDYVYKIQADEAGVAKIIVRMRNTNNIGGGVNGEYQLNKTLSVYNGVVAPENKIAIASSVVLKRSPEFADGACFFEYELGLANLAKGENVITLKFTHSGEVDTSGKQKGGYLQYMRIETLPAYDCASGNHDLTYIEKAAPTCTSMGINGHMKCNLCGKLYTLGELKETTLTELSTTPKLEHVLDTTVTYVDGTSHTASCVMCGKTITKSHTHTEGEHHLVIAKEPNKVWYAVGEKLDVDRMEVYASDICADGCNNTKKIDEKTITCTYAKGEAFSAGDTYVSISVTDGANVYTGKVNVTVVNSSDNMLNIDDKNASLKQTDGGNVSRRNNDQGAIGQSGFGGTYISGARPGDSVTFTFTSIKTSGKLTLQGASNNVVPVGDSFPEYASGMKLNGIMDITVNGVKLTIDDSAFLKGSTKNLEQGTNRWVWTNWTTIDLGNVALNEGKNKIVVTFKNDLGFPDATCGQIDCFNIYY